MVSITAEERRWRAQDDARTLANANVIKQDPTRLAAAKAEAARMAEEQAKEANAMRGVAKTGQTAAPKKAPRAQRAARRRPSGKSGTNHNVFTRLDR